MNTYIGQKGYTIAKDELTQKQIDQIKKDLSVKPFSPGTPMHLQKSFPVYRESVKKLYVPRYYGEEQFGLANEIRIAEGQPADLTFIGTLRDYQRPVVEKFINHVTSQSSLGGLLELPCAWGKTSASLYICSQLKKKTLVIVHKEFLLNQWVERIQQFIPTARIGRIQGQTIDVENKDIVLCMLQSLVLKEYPQSVFDDFGFTIIDEVHHISSETFSTALFKIVTKYMLGLSATMNRKDGTTKVFKMFLGDVVHKVERKGEHNVEIRAVTYKSDDSEFNETILDYKGQPQISSMISKLCAYEPRTDFIIELLKDCIRVEVQVPYTPPPLAQCACCGVRKYLVRNTCCKDPKGPTSKDTGVTKYCLTCMQNVVKNVEAKKRPKCPNCNKVLKFEQNYVENPNVKPLEQCHTIVLSHNLNILEYMYNRIVNENIASVGYYIGGMHEEDMKKSEKKQIVLATYAVANEGLDIPSLNVEFLITPKTDVVQTIGRVLRAKHAYADPVIYDIVDSHEVFQRQWAKRKSYYVKNNYSIIGCNSKNYSRNTSQWKVINSLKESSSQESEEQEDNKPLGKCIIEI